jgi:hypothetical protein
MEGAIEEKHKVRAEVRLFKNALSLYVSNFSAG